MKTYKVHGTTVVDVWVVVEAKSEEEAIDYVEGWVHTVEYCNGTMGVEDNYNYSDVELGSNDWIEWDDMEVINDDGIDDNEDDEDEEE